MIIGMVGIMIRCDSCALLLHGRLKNAVHCQVLFLIIGHAIFICNVPQTMCFRCELLKCTSVKNTQLMQQCDDSEDIKITIAAMYLLFHSLTFV